jgi:hypothetical protein
MSSSPPELGALALALTATDAATDAPLGVGTRTGWPQPVHFTFRPANRAAMTPRRPHEHSIPIVPVEVMAVVTGTLSLVGGLLPTWACRTRRVPGSTPGGCWT